MADIDVVPKRKTNVWLWVIVALLVIVALWFMFARNGSSQVGDLGMESIGSFAVAIAAAPVH